MGGDEADRDQARPVGRGGCRVVAQAAPPCIEGGGGDALAVAEGGDGQATVAIALKAPLPALASRGVRSSAGS